MESMCWIKCNKCNAVMAVDSSEQDVSYVCEKCHSAIYVKFYWRCSCNNRVNGHRLLTVGELAERSIVRAVKSLLSPFRSVREAMERLVTIVPKAKAYGYCHFCHRLRMVCPHCHAKNEISGAHEMNKTEVCLECGEEFLHP